MNSQSTTDRFDWPPLWQYKLERVIYTLPAGMPALARAFLNEQLFMFF